MSEYDVVFNVLIRLESSTGADISLNIGDYSEKIGNLISEEYPNYLIAPLGMERVEDDKRVRILDKITYEEFDEDFEE